MSFSSILENYLSLNPPPSPFEPPSLLYTILFHPVTTLFSYLHKSLTTLRGSPYILTPNAVACPIRIVCISDTHDEIPPKLPTGDLLIHAGDLTDKGTVLDIQKQIDWLASTKESHGFQHIVVICGNHDSYFDERSRSQHDKRNPKNKPRWPAGMHYLQHSSAQLSFSSFESDVKRSLNVYGAPQIPRCGGKEFAFQYQRGQDAWTGTIPMDTDVLVTHNPPKYHLDITENEIAGQGCEYLLKEVKRVKPSLHVCGHVHADGGRRENIWWDESERTWEEFAQRGYASGNKGLWGAFADMFDVRLWFLGMRLVFQDCKGVIWNRVWGGNVGGTILVNAALSYRATGRLGNRPQAIVL